SQPELRPGLDERHATGCEETMPSRGVPSTFCRRNVVSVPQNPSTFVLSPPTGLTGGSGRTGLFTGVVPPDRMSPRRAYRWSPGHCVCDTLRCPYSGAPLPHHLPLPSA